MGILCYFSTRKWTNPAPVGMKLTYQLVTLFANCIVKRAHHDLGLLPEGAYHNLGPFLVLVSVADRFGISFAGAPRAPQ